MSPSLSPFVTYKTCFCTGADAKLVIDGNFVVYAMPKKNLSIVLVIVLTVLLIALTIWVFDRRIGHIKRMMKPTVSIQ